MTQSSFDFDLFVIGGGSGGVRAARIAAQHGARVGIAEGFRYGGTCVIRGCVPKKLLVYASRFPQSFEESRGFGWNVPSATFDWESSSPPRMPRSRGWKAPIPPTWTRPA